MFKYLNTPSKGSRHTDYTFVTDTQITHLLRTHRFHICHSTEVLTNTAFYSLGLRRYTREVERDVVAQIIPTSYIVNQLYKITSL